MAGTPHPRASEGMATSTSEPGEQGSVREVYEAGFSGIEAFDKEPLCGGEVEGGGEVPRYRNPVR